MFKNWRFWLPIVVVGSSGFFGLTYTFFIIRNRKRKNKPQDYHPIPSNEESEEIPKNKKVIVLGLDNSGKSEFMSNLSHSNNTPREKIEPTDGFHVISTLSINYWEIGGQKKLREYWPNFYIDTRLVLFIIDSKNKERFDEAATELQNLANDVRLNNIPFLVLINNKGQGICASEEEVKKALKIETIQRIKCENENGNCLIVLSCNVRDYQSVIHVQDKIKDLLKAD